jgi:hypothetical protein
MTYDEILQLIETKVRHDEEWGGIIGQHTVARYIANKFSEIKNTSVAESWENNPDRMGGQFTDEEMTRGWGSEGW